jgi:ankyrin repeat protein
VVEVLLEFESDVNRLTGGRSTALILAAEFKDHYEERVQICKLLIDKGCNVDAVENAMRSVLVHYLALEGWTEVIEHLINNRKGNFQLQDQQGKMALQIAAESGHAGNDVIFFLIYSSNVSE